MLKSNKLNLDVICQIVPLWKEQFLRIIKEVLDQLEKLYCEKEHLLSHRSPARAIIQRKLRVIELNRELFIFVICMLLPRRQTLWMVNKLRPEKLTLCVSPKLGTRKI